MSFQNALTPFNANSVDDRESRGLREHYEHSQRYCESDKENMVSQLSILLTFLKKFPLPEAPTQAQQALTLLYIFYPALEASHYPQPLSSTISFLPVLHPCLFEPQLQMVTSFYPLLLAQFLLLLSTTSRLIARQLLMFFIITLSILWLNIMKLVRVDILAISLSWTLMPGLTHI